MCGISGYFNINGFVPQEELQSASAALIHRGPDNGGFFIDERVGLAHRRLSIIDTSEAGNQPMISRNENLVIVFNGEMYNYKEVAEDFNLKLRTTSDTEVLIEAYALRGKDVISCFNGMFSFAIYDKSSRQLQLFRDRMGIKPLYYSWDGNIFFFASEIKALLKYEAIRKSAGINYSAVAEYLHLGYIPEPFTIYNNIHQVKAGHYITVNMDGMEEIGYWNIQQSIQSGVLSDEVEATRRLDELICSSVKYRLNCDVPFGTFLSGGIDSSLVTAIARKIYPQQLKTFSIGFSDSGFNESEHAREVANALSTDHHTFMVREKDALELLDECLEMFDQPFADSSAIPTLLVSRLAAKEVKMVLSGDGGDELFMGYGAYRWAERLNNPLLFSLRKPLSMIFSAGTSRFQRIGKLLDYRKGDDLKSHIFSQEQYLFSREETAKILNPDIAAGSKHIFQPDDLARKLSPAEQQALFDLKYYLKDDLLVKVDRASMHASLECRLPLLDYRIVEWAMNLDPGLKIKGNVAKYLLKKVLYSHLPEQLFRRPKWGFAIPLSAWLNGPLFYFPEEYLSEEKVKAYNVLNFEEVTKLLCRYRNGSSAYLYNRVWALAVLQKMLPAL